LLGLSITTCRLVEKLPAAPLEEEAARSGERTPVVKGRDPDCGQQQRLNHGSLCAYRKQFAFRPCAVQGELLFKREKKPAAASENPESTRTTL
jgi:hypothetical protein